MTKRNAGLLCSPPSSALAIGSIFLRSPILDIHMVKPRLRTGVPHSPEWCRCPFIPKEAPRAERAVIKSICKAVFLSGLNQTTCTNGHLKPDFLKNVFQVPGGRGGSVEVRGVRGRHAGHRELKQNGQKKLKNAKQKDLKW